MKYGLNLEKSILEKWKYSKKLDFFCLSSAVLVFQIWSIDPKKRGLGIQKILDSRLIWAFDIPNMA